MNIQEIITQKLLQELPTSINHTGPSKSETNELFNIIYKRNTDKTYLIDIAIGNTLIITITNTHITTTHNNPHQPRLKIPLSNPNLIPLTIAHTQKILQN